MKEFFQELRRRHIFRVALTYLVVAWLLIQVVNNITEPLGLPGWMPTFVIVLLGLGFPVALVLAWAFEGTHEGVKPALEGGAKTPPVAPLGRKWDFVIIGLMAVALGYFVWERQATTEAEQTAPQNVAEASVAVLPFANLSPDPDQEYFADGISEEILNSLAQIQDLQVAGRTSSFYFKGKDQDLRTIGEKLNVAHVLEGSVRRAGDNVRITAQLVNAETGYHLWSETYDRTLEDIFAIQSEIAESVANALEITLGVGELGRRPGMTRNVEAYDAYLRSGTNLSGTAAANRARIDSLERAVELDPSFAIAWTQLAVAYWNSSLVRGRQAATRNQAKAEKALARARELAPEAPVVLTRAAIFAGGRGDLRQADRLFRKALAKSDDPYVLRGFGEYLYAAGKAEEAISYLLEARRADPLWPATSLFLSMAYAATGQLDKAMAEADRGDAIDPPSGPLRQMGLFTALAGGDDAEIERRIDRLLLTDFVARAIIETMRPYFDDPDGAAAELRRLYAMPENAAVLRRATIGYMAAYFGAHDLALKQIKDVGGRISAWHPLMREVRKLPGFKDFVREAGLVDYWRETGWGEFCRPVGADDFECE